MIDLQFLSSDNYNKNCNIHNRKKRHKCASKSRGDKAHSVHPVPKSRGICPSVHPTIDAHARECTNRVKISVIKRNSVTSVPFVTRVRLPFLFVGRAAGRIVRCGFGYVTFVMFPRTRHAAAHLYASAHQCFRALVLRRAAVCRRASLGPRVYVLPRTFVYGRAVLYISAHSLDATHGKCCRALDMLPRAAGIVIVFGCVAAHLSW